MLSIIMLSVIMLSIIMPSIVMLSVVMLSVVMPKIYHRSAKKLHVSTIRLVTKTVPLHFVENKLTDNIWPTTFDRQHLTNNI